MEEGQCQGFNGPILYWSGLYILECHDNVFLYQSPPKALIGQHLTANTTTSLSTVRTYALVWPRSTACARGRRILVSASEWLHGLLEITVWNLVLRRSFPPISFLDICVLMNENSYFLLFSFLRKPLFHSYCGILVLPMPILVHGPFPRRFCVKALMLFSSG